MNPENEKELYSLVMNAPVGICVLNAETLTAEIVNESYCSATGKRSEDIIGNFHWNIFSEVRKKYEPVLANVIASGEAYHADEAEMILVRRGNEETVYLTFSYVPLRNLDGKITKAAVWVIENTSQVLQRQKVEQSEKFANTVFYNSPAAKLVFEGNEMRVQQANEKMLEILGADFSIVGQPLMDAVPELKKSSLFEEYHKVLETGEIYNKNDQKIELVKDGLPVTGYFDYTYKPLHNSEGNIYGVIFTAVDVTKQVIARNKLEEAESDIRGAVELAQLGRWSIDVATNGLSYSDRLIEWFGYDPAALDFNQVIPILAEEDQERVTKAVEWGLNPQSGGIYDEIYTIIHPKTGKKRVLHAQGKTVFDPEGNPVRMNGTAQDITIQVQAQIELENQVQERTEEIATIVEELTATNEELEETNVRLMHSNEELAQFAYIASHDLQEPLRKISTFTELLQGKIGEHLDEKTNAYFSKIKDASARMGTLIRDVLAYSALPKKDDSFEPVDLEETVRHSLEDYDLLIEKTGAEITWDHLPIIAGIPLQMNQLFTNLIGNALKFVRPDNKPVIRITCTAASADEIKLYNLKTNNPYHKIQLTDNGIGMKPEDTEKIFSIFQRLHRKDVFAGTGIGLAMCKKIVVNHNGEINADGSSENGAVFNVFLPA